MLDQAIELARRTPVENYTSGSDAKFLRINDNWGMKLFETERERDKNYNRQNLANEHGAAPAIGEKLFVELPENGSYYGFITECIVETYWDRHGSNENDVNSIDDKMKEDEEYQKLIVILDDTTGSYDMHANNVGYMPDGRLVAIDFSRSNDGY